jgi:hypothetical protein
VAGLPIFFCVAGKFPLMTFAMRNSLFLIQLFWGQKIHEKINLGTQ